MIHQGKTRAETVAKAVKIDFYLSLLQNQVRELSTETTGLGGCMRKWEVTAKDQEIGTNNSISPDTSGPGEELLQENAKQTEDGPPVETPEKLSPNQKKKKKNS